MNVAARLSIQLLVGLSCLLVQVGCGGGPDDEKISLMEEHSDAIYAMLLHNQVVKHNGKSWRLQLVDITEIELHERTDATADGEQTAVLSFSMRSARRRVKARITYKKVDGQPDEESHGVASIPVTKFEVLSVTGG